MRVTRTDRLVFSTRICHRLLRVHVYKFWQRVILWTPFTTSQYFVVSPWRNCRCIDRMVSPVASIRNVAASFSLVGNGLLKLIDTAQHLLHGWFYLLNFLTCLKLGIINHIVFSMMFFMSELLNLRRNVLKCSIPATPPWVFKWAHIDYSIHQSSKDNTSPEICRNKFFEFCDCLLYTSPSPRD